MRSIAWRLRKESKERYFFLFVSLIVKFSVQHFLRSMIAIKTRLFDVDADWFQMKRRSLKTIKSFLFWRICESYCRVCRQMQTIIFLLKTLLFKIKGKFLLKSHLYFHRAWIIAFLINRILFQSILINQIGNRYHVRNWSIFNDKPQCDFSCNFCTHTW